MLPFYATFQDYARVPGLFKATIYAPSYMHTRYTFGLILGWVIADGDLKPVMYEVDNDEVE